MIFSVPLVLVGLSHKTAPVDVREQAFIPEARAGECIRRLIDHDVIESGLMLSTCNRTELYAQSRIDDGEHRLVEAFAAWPHELSYETWRRCAFQLSGEDALAHLFHVAAGLDSMVVGEGQVLAQLKQALASAQAARSLDADLEIAVRGAIRAGKRVRQETELGRLAVSVSHAAVVRARELLGDLRGRGVLLVGTGEMSEVAMRLFRKHGVQEIAVASKSRPRAQEMLRAAGGRAVDLEAVDGLMATVDVVICSSAASRPLFDRPRVEAWQASRDHRPLLVIDIAVPRDVDPAAADVAGVRLFNIDDLREVAERNLARRESAIPAAERIVEEELRRTLAALEAREVAPAVRALVKRIEGLRDEELDRHLSRLPEGDAATRDAMRHLATSLTAKFLHAPIARLRGSPQPRVDAALLADAFAVTPEDAADG